MVVHTFDASYQQAQQADKSLSLRPAGLQMSSRKTRAVQRNPVLGGGETKQKELRVFHRCSIHLYFFIYCILTLVGKAKTGLLNWELFHCQNPRLS